MTHWHAHWKIPKLAKRVSSFKFNLKKGDTHDLRSQIRPHPQTHEISSVF